MTRNIWNITDELEFSITLMDFELETLDVGLRNITDVLEFQVHLLGCVLCMLEEYYGTVTKATIFLIWNYCRVLFNETFSLAQGFPSESIEQEAIEPLPLARQHLLHHLFYDGWVPTLGLQLCGISCLSLLRVVLCTPLNRIWKNIIFHGITQSVKARHVRGESSIYKCTVHL